MLKASRSKIYSVELFRVHYKAIRKPSCIINKQQQELEALQTQFKALEGQLEE